MCLCTANAIAIDVYHVKTDGHDEDGYDGKTWARAFKTIQNAINASKTGDTIKVGQGTFNSSIQDEINNKSIILKGGYNTLNGIQDYSNKTILDGLSQYRILRVIYGSVVYIDGFVFKNAKSAGYSGALVFDGANGIVSNCEFTNNVSPDYGGGGLAFLNMSSSTSKVINCSFSGNLAKEGGAVYCGSGTIVDVINCTITNNTSKLSKGAGVYSRGTLNLKNSIVWGNTNYDGAVNFTVNPNLQSNMVLQQNKNFTISGKGAPRELIRVYCSWEPSNSYHTAVISSDSLWSTTIMTPMGSFDSRTILVEGKNKMYFSNILVGEVWLCSGQSNMMFYVSNATNGASEVINADSYPNIRLLNMARVKSDNKINTFNSKWQICSKTTIPNFSAVAYFFGRKLYQDLNVPIGLINASWGDTTCEVWADRDSVLNCTDPNVVSGATTNDNTPRVDPSTPYKIGSAYNGMIYPLRNIPMAGAIWYQGESNVGHPYYYPGLLNVLVNSWRHLFNCSASAFPFYISQICPYTRKFAFPTYYANPTMRFIQMNASDLILNSGVESNDDIGDLTTIHPANKQDVGLRLAWLALNKTYGKTEYYNKLTPFFKEYSIYANQLRITFKNVGDGLKTIDGLPPTMFEIAGSNKVFYPANATISGIDKVILSNPNVTNPIAARLGWSYIKTTNLVSTENLPVSVFKTYNWLDTTEEP